MTNNIISFIKPPKKIPCCSFCERKETEVAKLFSNGIDKYICDQCVVHAKKRLDEETENDQQSN